MSLADIVNEIKKIQVYVDEDVESGPSETLNGRRGRKNQAIGRMADLKRAYREELLRTAIFIVVSGSEKGSFTTLATEKAKCLAADPEEFYNDLANRLAPAVLSGRQTMDNAFDVMGRHLEDKSIELGLSAYPQVVFKQQYGRAIKTKEDLAAVIKQAINDQMGAEIVGVQAVSTIVKPAIERGHKEKFTAVLLPTDDLKLQAALLKDLRRLSPNVFSIIAGTIDPGPETSIVNERILLLEGEVSMKSVKSILTKIRDLSK